ncbi:hypothetical protein Drorol1_Dr00025466 [Drosera rotundifolia]
MWPVVDKPKLFPPDVVSRPGRPKKARRREPEEADPVVLSKRGLKMSCHGCVREGHNKRGCRHKDEWDAYAAALVADKIASTEKRASRAKENAAKKVASAKKVAKQNATKAKENAAKQNVARRFATGGTTLIDDPKNQQVNDDTASLDDAASLGSVFLSTFDRSQITLILMKITEAVMVRRRLWSGDDDDNGAERRRRRFPIQF